MRAGLVTLDFSLRSLPDPNGKGLKFAGRSDARGEVPDCWDLRNPGLLGLLPQRGRSKSEIEMAEPLQCLQVLGEARDGVCCFARAGDLAWE